MEVRNVVDRSGRMATMKRVLAYLMPVEVCLLLFGALTAALYYFLEVRLPGAPGSGGPIGPGAFYLKQFLTSLDLYAVILTGMVVFRAGALLRENGWSVGRTNWRDFWARQSRRFHMAEMLQDIRFFHAVLVMFLLFALLKNLIPHVNPYVFDEWFVWSEELVCGGKLCGEVLHSLLGYQAVTAVGKHYHWYYPYMSIVAFLFIVVADRKLAHEYLFAFVLLFLVGVLWVYAIPTWGPVYARPDRYEVFAGTDTHGLQYALWVMKEQLAKDPARGDAVYMISGFPSLHVAVVMLGSYYLARIHRLLSLLSWSFTLLVIHSTVFLGWHYVLDDVGSALLVVLCIVMARRVHWAWRRDLVQSVGLEGAEGATSSFS